MSYWSSVTGGHRTCPSNRGFLSCSEGASSAFLVLRGELLLCRIELEGLDAIADLRSQDLDLCHDASECRGRARVRVGERSLVEVAYVGDVRCQFKDISADFVDASEEILKRIGCACIADSSGRIRVVRGFGNGQDPVASGSWGFKSLKPLELPPTLSPATCLPIYDVPPTTCNSTY